VKSIIRTHDDLSYVPLAPDYPLARWRNDDGVDREVRRFFRTLLTKSPYLVDVEDDAIAIRNDRSQFSYQGDEAKGLGVAYLLDALALSFRSARRWEYNRLELTVIELDNEGELSEELTLDVVHACSEDHVLDHTAWIKERIHEVQKDVFDGLDLWTHKVDLFPSLQFCESVRIQLQEVLRGQLILHSIMKKLSELDKFCHDWQDGPFDPQKVPGKITAESGITLEKFEQEHTFLCPDGERRIFNWHARLTPGAWRIYFYPQEETKQITIGYIGLHLPTALYHS